MALGIIASNLLRRAMLTNIAAWREAARAEA
jgi:hypothetical protein